MQLELNVVNEIDNKVFRVVQNTGMGESDINQFMQLRNQLVIAADIFGGGRNLSPIHIPTMSKDMDEQLTLAHKMVDVVDRAKGKILVTTLYSYMEKLDSANAQVRFFATKKKEEQIQEINFANSKHDDYNYQLAF